MKIRHLISYLAATSAAVCLAMIMTSCADLDGHVHSFGEFCVESAPTCAQEGTMVRVCDICGARETAMIEKIPHTEATVPSRAATCTQLGATEGKICSVCAEVTVPQEQIFVPHAYFKGECTECGGKVSEADAVNVDYGAEADPSLYSPSDSSLPGYTLVDLDIKRTDLSLVYNSSDGFYHYMRSDGPTVLLKTDVKTAYTEPLSELLRDPSVRKYVYRDSRQELRKIDYGGMLEKYLQASRIESGGIGVYPFDEHLAEALKDIGAENGWWGVYASEDTQIFGSDLDGILAENAWMFALCYAELRPTVHRIVLRDKNGGAIVGAGVTVSDDEGFVLGRALTDSDGVAELIFKHGYGLSVSFDSSLYEDYSIPADGYRLESDVLTVVLDAATDSDGDGADDYDPEDKYKEYNWSTAEIKMQISEQGLGNGLTPVYRRMLAGETMNAADIDLLVADRNRKMSGTVHAEIVYSYVTDTADDYSLGTVGDGITERILALGSSAPDVFCAGVNSLIAASLKGCFYNMSSAGEDNHFSFNEYGYGSGSETYGYTAELMSELSLSPTKKFILASDYLTDTVRALTVVPVNVSLLEGIAADGDLEFLGDNGFVDADRFHEAVMSGKWDYALLISLCGAVYDAESDICGFMTDTSSASASSALLYSADINIFERVTDAQMRKYSCVFEETNDGFIKLSSAIAQLCASTGISAQSTDAENIRSRFARSRLLFGGTVPLAALESDGYKDAVDAGVYIAPIPKLDVGDSYRTVLDSAARLIAINTSCPRLNAVTAFLDYQSTHSTKIIEAYCLYGILYGAIGAGERNREALGLIRSSFYPSFESVYDLAVGIYFSADADARPLCLSLCDCDFRLTDADSLWRTYSAKRAEYMKRLLKIYEAI